MKEENIITEMPPEKRTPGFNEFTKSENSNNCVSRSHSGRTFSKHSTANDVLEGIVLTDKVFFVTGGNSGIGFETAKALALQNATVVIACRNVTKAVNAIENIRNEKEDAKVTYLQIDNADLESVHDCAEKFMTSHKKLDCLILNAGVYNPIHRITDNEFEATFQINYLAHFYLTQLLSPLLAASAPSKVVAVASEAHKGIGGNLTIDKITWEHLSPTHKRTFNSASFAYGLSKTCLILFTNEFNRRYSPNGVTANSCHPGLIVDHTQIDRNSKLLHLIKVAAAPFRKRPDESAATVVYCATSDDAQGGRYFSNCHQIHASHAARNVESGQMLWDLSEMMLTTYLEQKQRTLKHVVGVGNQATIE